MGLFDLLNKFPSAQDRYSQLAGMGLLGDGGISMGGGLQMPATGGASHWENVARRVALGNGYSPSEWKMLDSIIERESGWNPNAVNDSSGAAGIAQKISGYGPGYQQSNPMQQIRWLLNYIEDRYGGPQQALSHKNSTGWY